MEPVITAKRSTSDTAEVATGSQHEKIERYRTAHTAVLDSDEKLFVLATFGPLWFTVEDARQELFEDLDTLLVSAKLQGYVREGFLISKCL